MVTAARIQAAKKTAALKANNARLKAEVAALRDGLRRILAKLDELIETNRKGE